MALTTNRPSSAPLDEAFVCGILGTLCVIIALSYRLFHSSSKSSRVPREILALSLFSAVCAIAGLVLIVAGTQSQGATFLVVFIATVATGIVAWRALMPIAD